MSVLSSLDFLLSVHQRLWRSKRIQTFMKKDLKDVKLPALTKEQKQMISEVWKGIKVDTKWLAFFNLFNEKGKEWTPLYVPSNLHYSIIDMYYTDYLLCRTIEDKNLYSLLFNDVNQPKTIARKIAGNLFDADYNNLDYSELLKRIDSKKSYITKPTLVTGGGRGIVVWMPMGKGSLEDFIKIIESNDNCIVQEFANQHEEMASLHKESINTIRIITFFHDGKAKALSTITRMGVGGSSIDNASAGGIFCGVDESGRLKDIAYNDYGDVFKIHPTTHAIYSKHQIPNYNKLLELAERLHNRIVVYSKLVSWDFAIDENGNPILIEVNPTHGGISFHQMCNGPLFGEMTKEVIAEVFDKKNKRLSYIV